MDLFGDLPDPVSESENELSPKTRDKSEAARMALPTSSQKRKFHEYIKSSNNSETLPNKRLNSALFKTRGYLAERKGEREEMQDSHYLSDDLTSQIPNVDPAVSRISFYGLYDGHSGARAAKFAAQQLHENILEKFPKGGIANIEKEMKKSITEAFKKTDDEFLKLATKTRPHWKDGSTAICVLVINNTLYICNLGDSKAVLCRQAPDSERIVSVPLSQDHSPLQYDERIRIQKAGGQVRDGRVMGQLEVSRSLGDGPFKKLGVSCIPDVKRCQLTEQDKYVIIACDGLWKTFDNESAINFVNNIVSDRDVEATETKTAEDIIFEMAANRLASEAVRRLSADNVTVILVSLTRPK